MRNPRCILRDLRKSPGFTAVALPIALVSPGRLLAARPACGKNGSRGSAALRMRCPERLPEATEDE